MSEVIILVSNDYLKLCRVYTIAGSYYLYRSSMGIAVAIFLDFVAGCSVHLFSKKCHDFYYFLLLCFSPFSLLLFATVICFNNLIEVKLD